MRVIINHWRKWKIPSVELQNKPCILGEGVILKFLITNVSLSAHFLTWGKNFRTSHFVSQLSTIKASSQIKSFHFWGLPVITWTSKFANTKFRTFSILETKLSIATKVFVYTTPLPHSWEGISFVSETSAPIPVLYSGSFSLSHVMSISLRLTFHCWGVKFKNISSEGPLFLHLTHTHKSLFIRSLCGICIKKIIILEIKCILPPACYGSLLCLCMEVHRNHADNRVP